MKLSLQLHKIQIKAKLSYLLFGFFLLASNVSFGQTSDPNLTISKVAVEDGTVCNQFNVTLSVTGNPPPQPVETVLVIDRSGSMDNDDGDPNTPLPIEAAQDAALNFINELFSTANNPTGLNRVGLVTYSDRATQDVQLLLDTPANRQTLEDAINNIITTLVIGKQ